MSLSSGSTCCPKLETYPCSAYAPRTSASISMLSDEKLVANTCQVHYILLQSALEAAVNERLVEDNVARRMTGKPSKTRGEDSQEEATKHCWEPHEAQRFLAAAHNAGPPNGLPLFTLGRLDTGMRKGELCGLKWEDIDWGGRGPYCPAQA